MSPETTTLPAAVQARRDEAETRLQATGWPRPGDEAWRHSDVRALSRVTKPAVPGDACAADLDALRLPDTTRVVVVDGVLRPDLSDDLGGIDVCDLATALGAADVQAALGAIAGPDAFADWNLVHHAGGVVVRVPDHAVVDPLHLLLVRTDAPGVVASRLLVLAGDRSEVRVTEHHVHLGAGADPSGLATNHVTEVEAAQSAVVHLDVLQEAGPFAHVATTDLRARRDAQLRHVHVASGGSHARNTLVARLLGEGANVQLDGLYFTRGTQRSDHWTRVDHAVPHCSSRQRYKGILDDESRGAFTGNVLVRPGAQKTSSEQENRNLLLSRKALCDSTPQLEIHNDDVRCSHGSTVGQLDRDQQFFLRSRGIGADDATRMLTEAFAAEVVESLAPPARARVGRLIEDWFRSKP